MERDQISKYRRAEGTGSSLLVSTAPWLADDGNMKIASDLRILFGVFEGPTSTSSFPRHSVLPVPEKARKILAGVIELAN